MPLSIAIPAFSLPSVTVPPQLFAAVPPIESGGGTGVRTVAEIVSGGFVGTKAAWLPMAAIDLNPEVDPESVVAGSILHRRSDGMHDLGVAAFVNAATAPPTYIAVNNAYDFDAKSDDNGMVGVGVDESGVYTTVPQLAAIPTSATIEMESSYFDSTRDYAPGDLLTANYTGRLIPLGDVSLPATAVGVVTRGPKLNAQGISTLRFQTCFLPNFRG